MNEHAALVQVDHYRTGSGVVSFRDHFVRIERPGIVLRLQLRADADQAEVLDALGKVTKRIETYWGEWSADGRSWL
jgi:hypothetical protein